MARTQAAPVARPMGSLERPVKTRSFLERAAYRFVRRRIAIVGGVLVVLLAFIGVFGSLISPYDPAQQDLRNILASPTFAHPLGTDHLGRDILSRALTGASTSLLIGIGAVLVATTAGVALGAVVAYRGGILDNSVMRVLDGWMAFPSLVLALTIVAVVGPGVVTLILAIAFPSFPLYARLVRGQVLSVRELDFVLAATVIGAHDLRIVFRHVLTNVMSPVIVQASLGVGFAIIAESSLSFLGVGVPPPHPAWGSMIQVGFQYLEVSPWQAFGPGVLIFTSVLAFNLLGDGLREALDPRLGD